MSADNTLHKRGKHFKHKPMKVAPTLLREPLVAAAPARGRAGGVRAENK